MKITKEDIVAHCKVIKALAGLSYHMKEAALSMTDVLHSQATDKQEKDMAMSTVLGILNNAEQKS